MDAITWANIPENKRPESRIVTRSVIKQVELPIMKSVKNKVDTYFYHAEPILEQDE